MKYNCYMSVMATKYLGVFEAESAEEAEELAEKQIENLPVCANNGCELAGFEIVEIIADLLDET